jgi:hypothetical protein
MKHKPQLLILIILTCHFELTTSFPYTADKIDKQLQQINTALVNEEAKIERQMLDLVAFINQTNSNLKSQNKSMTKQQQLHISNLCAELENLISLLTDLATLDNYWPYSSLKSCSDANRKVTEIDFDTRQYLDLISKTASNITRLAKENIWVAYYHGLAYTTLVMNYNNGLEMQRRVATVMTSTNGVIIEYWNYIGQLARARGNETIIGTYLNLFKKQFCVCGMDMTANIGSNLSTLEGNVQVIERPLVQLQTEVLTLANSALVNAQAAAASLVGSPAPLLIITVDRTKTFLAHLVTAADYRNITWNSVSVCSDLHIRIGLVWFKYWQYLQTLVACGTNTTWTTFNRAGLNATAVGVKLNDKQVVAVRGLIGDMTRLEVVMRNYTSQLAYSVVKMVRVWIDMRFFGDTYCGCRDINATGAVAEIKTSTTSLMTTTTTSKATTSKNRISIKNNFLCHFLIFFTFFI